MNTDGNTTGGDERENEVSFVIRHIAGTIFDLFQRDIPIDKKLYWIDIETLACAIQDAFSDIHRVGSYHSKTGANIYKKAAYIAKWIAEAKPINIDKKYPRNLTNNEHLNSLRLNAIFAVYVMEAILGEHMTMYGKLRLDLRYIFIFRHRTEASSIAMLLEHALKYSKR